jgi:hypothetical protein
MAARSKPGGCLVLIAACFTVPYAILAAGAIFGSRYYEEKREQARVERSR